MGIIDDSTGGYTCIDEIHQARKSEKAVRSARPYSLHDMNKEDNIDVPNHILDRLHEVAQGEKPARGAMDGMFIELSDHEDHEVAIHLDKEEAFRLWGILDIAPVHMTVSVESRELFLSIRDRIMDIMEDC